MTWILVLALPPLALALAYARAPLFLWGGAGYAWWIALGVSVGLPLWLTVLGVFVWTGLLVLVGHVPTRQRLLTAPLFRAFAKALPLMSQTEREALEAGTVWWEAELFRGNPDWSKLLATPWPKLTAEEQAFLDNETEELCRLVDDWACGLTKDMPDAVWRYIKEKGFLGMIIPKEYGGKGFSAYAHSQVITKLSTRSSAPAVTVMVPNSLGPAELLLHYGTPEQKAHYLPRLARGEEIPAFALTSPWAGSDAASLPDAGVVCRGQWQGKDVIGIRVSFNKRYITLAPVCTVFGLAFQLFDPDNLLGRGQEIGITLALIPANHPGVEIGRRHLPLDAAWMNGPIRGEDVFIPLDFVIGGEAMVGQGWRMLMECLAAGRSISLPGSNTGMQQLTARTVGAYARVRYQFKTQIGRFEGVEEALARIGGNTYVCDAARVLTAAAVDQGQKPSVVSAIVKYHVTERARQTVNDGMDVIGGKGICLGPQNFLGRAYEQIPVGITVEGANILTRSLILFGQGAVRCHPYVLEEMRAAHAGDLASFDRAFWAHVVHTLSNGARAIVMGLTGARFVRGPQGVAPQTRRYYQQLTRFSAAFAFLADVSMGVLGGALKRKERLSARLGDILAQLYLASAALRRFEADGRPADDLPLLQWAVWDAIYRAQNAFIGVIDNFPLPLARALARFAVFPLGRPYRLPDDRLGHEVAKTLITPGPARDRLTACVFLPQALEEPVAALEAALSATVRCEAIEAKVRVAQAQGRFTPSLEARASASVDAVWYEAHAAGVITDEELAQITERNRLRDLVIRVDDFPYDFGLKAAAAQLDDARIAATAAIPPASRPWPERQCLGEKANNRSFAALPN